MPAILGQDHRLLCQFDDQYIIERSYKLGVLAFVRKDESTEVLNEAIIMAAPGNIFPRDCAPTCMVGRQGSKPEPAAG